ncbi:hypothetical protein [Priestia megaterium]|nr:hypothetical protein [Priestia megaterium]
MTRYEKHRKQRNAEKEHRMKLVGSWSQVISLCITVGRWIAENVLK